MRSTLLLWHSVWLWSLNLIGLRGRWMPAPIFLPANLQLRSKRARHRRDDLTVPDSHRISFPSLIRASSDSVRTNSRYFCASKSCKAMGLNTEVLPVECRGGEPTF